MGKNIFMWKSISQRTLSVCYSMFRWVKYDYSFLSQGLYFSGCARFIFLVWVGLAGEAHLHMKAYISQDTGYVLLQVSFDWIAIAFSVWNPIN